MDDDSKVVTPDTADTRQFEFQTRMFEKGADAIQEHIIRIDEILFNKAIQKSFAESAYAENTVYPPDLRRQRIRQAEEIRQRFVSTFGGHSLSFPAVDTLWLLNNMGQTAINR